jgi:DNA-binding transcriptional LysR family regulator
MEFRHLKYFVAVAEMGSVSRAAEKLFIAQPPLSKQIKQLEDEVGVSLLLRYPRGVRLTAAGTAFLEHAKDLLARAERAKEIARHKDDVAGGMARVGFVPSAGHTVIPRLVRGLRSRHPECEIDLREMVTSQQTQALLHSEIDVGLLRPPITSGRLTITNELSDPFCLAIPDGHALAGAGPIDLRSAADEIFVGFTRQRGPAFYDQTLGLCTDLGFSPNLRYEASTLYGVLDLVGAGLGVAIVPASSSTLAPTGFGLRLLSRPTRAGCLALARSRGDPNPMLSTLSEATAAVFDELHAEIRQRVAGII